MKDVIDFPKHADDALSSLYQVLVQASEDYDFEVDLSDGALTVEFERPPAKFVVSSNSPVRQIWISARSKSYKLGWDVVQNTFVLASTDQTLTEVMEEALSEQIGEDVLL